MIFQTPCETFFSTASRQDLRPGPFLNANQLKSLSMISADRLLPACAAAIEKVTGHHVPPVHVEDFIANPKIVHLLNNESINCTQTIAHTLLTPEWLCDTILQERNTSLLIAVARLAGNLNATREEQDQQAFQETRELAIEYERQIVVLTNQKNETMERANREVERLTTTNAEHEQQMADQASHLMKQNRALADQLTTTNAEHEQQMEDQANHLMRQHRALKDQLKHLQMKYEQSQNRNRSMKMETVRLNNQIELFLGDSGNRDDVDKTMRELHHETDLLAHRLSRQKARVMEPIHILQEDNKTLIQKFESERRSSVSATSKVAELEIELMEKDATLDELHAALKNVQNERDRMLLFTIEALGKEKLASALGSPHVKQQWAKSKRG
jgi:chromosome segregation ATPase